MPISRVRSSTTTFMMFETPMPPTTSVNDPTIVRKPLNASMNVSKKRAISVVSQKNIASLSSGSKRCLPAISPSTSSVAASAPPGSRAVKIRLSMYFWPVSARKVDAGTNTLSLSRPL